MKYEIVKYEVEKNNLAGSQFASFKVYFKADEKEFYLPITFQHLKRSLLELDPPSYHYLENLRANLDGYGPKESEVIELSIEEEFDWLRVFQSFFNSPIGIESLNHFYELLTKPIPIEQKTEMQTFLADVKESSQKEYIDLNILSEQLEKAIHLTLISNYPIADKADKTDYSELKSLYIRSMMHLAERLEPILNRLLNRP